MNTKESFATLTVAVVGRLSKSTFTIPPCPPVSPELPVDILGNCN